MIVPIVRTGLGQTVQGQIVKINPTALEAGILKRAGILEEVVDPQKIGARFVEMLPNQRIEAEIGMMIPINLDILVMTTNSVVSEE